MLGARHACHNDRRPTWNRQKQTIPANSGHSVGSGHSGLHGSAWYNQGFEECGAARAHRRTALRHLGTWHLGTPAPPAHRHLNDPALLPLQVLRRARAARRGDLADRRSRARRAVRAQRRRQDHAAEDAGRPRGTRRRRRRQARGPHHRLSAAGRPGAQGPHRLRRGQPGVCAAARHEGRDARARRAHGRRRRVRRRAGGDARSVCRAERPVPAGGGLHGRPAGGDGPDRAGVLEGRLRPAGRHVLGRLADAHRAGQAAAGASRVCCCWTSRPTISISTRATGSRATCASIRTPSFSSATTASSSTRS